MNDKQTMTNDLIQRIESQLQTVYDPEFPIVDIWTLGLIYDIQIDEENHQIKLLITFTSPNCPSADQIQEQCITVINEALPMFTVDIEITFDPLWSFDKIKDPDLIRMFE
jgi:metal-sulfur cluster biosynthetic enzyme